MLLVISVSHTPVLFQEFLALAQRCCDATEQNAPLGLPAQPLWLIDGTLGRGGHAQGWLQMHATHHIPHVWGLDRDQEAITYAQEHLIPLYGTRLSLHHETFTNMHLVHPQGRIDLPGHVGLVFLDLGLSSPQVDQAERGFSWRFEGPLHMTMGLNTLSAHDVIHEAPHALLEDIFRTYGEEPQWRRLAHMLVQKRQETLFASTLDFAAWVTRVLRPWGRGIHRATLAFQALRIYVNDELGQLQVFLNQVPLWHEAGVAVAIISFHSLEDRLVKKAFQAVPQAVSTLTVPTRAECLINPRARSAKMRCLMPPTKPQSGRVSKIVSD